MFPTNLDALKFHQKEILKQAENYRLAKSLEQTDRWANRLYATVGRVLIIAGQNLVKRTLTAHYNRNLYI